uniref:Uncharacterized protein n=1 Tax=Desertifilum tharense IPPAS B-1220 TaxID=1781255 RepID=A0ACD5H1F8_9CYAN
MQRTATGAECAIEEWQNMNNQQHLVLTLAFTSALVAAPAWSQTTEEPTPRDRRARCRLNRSRLFI